MENQQVAYTFFHYIGVLSPLLFWLGLWLGKKLGKKKGLADLWDYIDMALGHPQKFIYAYAKDGKGPVKVQGTLIINRVEPLAKQVVLPIEANLPFIFRFDADKTQWQPGPCSDPKHWKAQTQ